MERFRKHSRNARTLSLTSFLLVFVTRGAKTQDLRFVLAPTCVVKNDDFCSKFVRLTLWSGIGDGVPPSLLLFPNFCFLQKEVFVAETADAVGVFEERRRVDKGHGGEDGITEEKGTALGGTCT